MPRPGPVYWVSLCLTLHSYPDHSAAIAIAHSYVNVGNDQPSFNNSYSFISVLMCNAVNEPALLCILLKVGVWHVLSQLFFVCFWLVSPLTTMLGVHTNATSTLHVWASVIGSTVHDFYSFFETLFYTKLPFPLPWWSKDLLVEKHAVGGQSTSKIHLWSSGMNADCIWWIDQHPACPNRGRLELWPRKWFLLGRNPWR